MQRIDLRVNRPRRRTHAEGEAEEEERDADASDDASRGLCRLGLVLTCKGHTNCCDYPAYSDEGERAQDDKPSTQPIDEED